MQFSHLTADILEGLIFKRIIERNALSVAKRLKSDLNQIFKLARKKKLIQFNPLEDIELPNPQGGNFAAVTEEGDFTVLVRQVWRYPQLHARSLISTQVALKVSVLIFQRPGEIRQLKKNYFYQEERCLKFISSKTKQQHIVR